MCPDEVSGGRGKSGGGWIAASGQTALADGFEQADGSGRGDVEALDFSGHRDADQLVATFGSEAAQAIFFGAEHDGERAGQFGVVEVIGGAVRGADTLYQMFVELLEGAGEVADCDYGHACGGSAGYAHDGIGDAATLMAGNNDGVDPGTFGGSQTGAQIVRILNAVEDQKKGGWCVAVVGTRVKIILGHARDAFAAGGCRVTVGASFGGSAGWLGLLTAGRHGE